MVSNLTKSTSTISTFTKTQVEDLLLKEDGSYLLLENGDRIILEQSVPHPVLNTNLARSTSVISMITKS